MRDAFHWGDTYNIVRYIYTHIYICNKYIYIYIRVTKGFPPIYQTPILVTRFGVHCLGLRDLENQTEKRMSNKMETQVS